MLDSRIQYGTFRIFLHDVPVSMYPGFDEKNKENTGADPAFAEGGFG